MAGTTPGPRRASAPVRPRVFASTTGHKREPLAATMAVFAKLGLRDLDLNLHPFVEGDLNAPAAAEMAAAHGLHIWAASGGWCDFFQDSPAIDDTFASVARQVSIATRLGVPQLRLFFGRRSFFEYTRAAHERVCRNLARLSRLHPDLMFVFENHDGASLHPEVCREILERVGRPNIWMNFDPINFAKVHVDPMAALEVVRPFVAHVHLKGLDNGKFCEFGSGQIDLTPVISTLLAAGYPGAFSVEYEGEDDGTVRLVQGITRAKALIEKLTA